MAVISLMCLAVLSTTVAQARSDFTRQLLQVPECSGECVAEFSKCAGRYFDTPVACCDPDLSCVKKNNSYSQCLTSERADANVANEGWDGEVLNCVSSAAGGYGGYGAGSYGAYGMNGGMNGGSNGMGGMDDDVTSVEEAILAGIAEDDAALAEDIASDSDVADGGTDGASGPSAREDEAANRSGSTSSPGSSTASVGLIVGLVAAAVLATVLVGGVVAYRNKRAGVPAASDPSSTAPSLS